MENALFEGVVAHRRDTAVKHHFNYPIFMALFDLDDLGGFFKRSRLWSLERWNWASFRRSDYLNPKIPSLKMAVQQEIKLQLDRDFDGEIFLLAHVRYLGFCFNPVSFYFCYDRDRLKYIVAEVNNTPWNERHSYVLECADTSTQTFRFDKNFHVSPFNPMQMNYRWRFSISEQNIRINMKSYQDSHCDFRANLSLKKQPANSKNLSLILLRFPAVTLKTVSAIYWQALKLSLKGARFYSHPTSQQEPDHGKLR